MKQHFWVFILSVLCVLLGCATTTPSKVYLPTNSSEVMSFYRNGVPIGTLTSDSAVAMVSLEPSEVSGVKYMRLWLLYKNTSGSSLLLDPLKAVKLSYFSDKKSFPEVGPESPSSILAAIENQKAMDMIAETVGGTLQALSAEPTTVTGSHGEALKVNDTEAKRSAIANNTTSTLVSTALMYDMFKNSFNSGILRKNTVFPGESVNGYVYFPLPKHVSYSNDVIYIRPEQSTYNLLIETQTGAKTIEFTPADGE